MPCASNASVFADKDYGFSEEAARVIAKVGQVRIAAEQLPTLITLPHGAVHPFQRLLLVVQQRVDLGHNKRRKSHMPQPLQALDHPTWQR